MTLPVMVSNIPPELQRVPQWVVWKLEHREGQPKPTKPPYDIQTGTYADVKDPNTWSPFEAARVALAVGSYSGIGFVLTPEDEFFGIDLDACIDPETGRIAAPALAIIDQLSTYTEISPSGRGIRIFGRGKLPPGARRKGTTEFYDAGRYLTVTGHHLPDTPTILEERSSTLALVHAATFPASGNGGNGDSHEPRVVRPVDLDDRALLERMFASANGAKIRALWQGDTQQTYESLSEADLALCSHLAFWTGRDPAHMDRLFRQSTLMREKWDERRGAQTYGELTIATACAGCSETYTPARERIAAPLELTTHESENRPLIAANETDATLATLTWLEMTKEPPRPIVWHWDGWVPTNSVALLAGAGEAMKSWLALYLAILTAAGRTALAPLDTDTPPLRQGPVLYITAENAIEEEQRRCGLLKAGLKLPDELPLTFLPAASLSLSNNTDYGQVVALVKALQSVAVFIDSAIALSDLESENDNPAVRAFMKTRVLPLAREHGATVFLLVHSPKPPTQPGARLSDEHVARGAGDWRNASDSTLYLKREPSLGERAVVLKHSKQRVGMRHRPIWFTLEDIIPEESIQIVYGGTFDDASGQAAAAGLGKAVTCAVDILRAEGMIVLPEMIKRLKAGGTSERTARRACDVLRGKVPWPFGLKIGQTCAVVADPNQRSGQKILLAFDSAAWDALAPEEEVE